MLRGDRGILAAFAGLILIGAAPQQSGKGAGEKAHSQPEPGQRAPAIALSSSKAVEEFDSPVLTKPCQPYQDNRDSDLCAQWKAADAAYNAAWWAMIATAVAAFGIIGLYWQIKLTREAVQDTGSATKAMHDSNDIAKAAQRPWLSIDIEPKAFEREGAALRCEIDIHVKNHGQSVAKNYCLFFRLKYTPAGEPREVDQIWEEFEAKKVSNRRVVIPGDTETFRHWQYDAFDHLEWNNDPGPAVGHVAALFVVSAFYQSDLTGDQWLRIDKAYWIARRIKGGRINAVIDKSFRGARKDLLVAEPFTSGTLGH